MDLSDVEPFSDIVCPKCNHKQVAPMRLGSFLLIAEMGKGGMGSVYRAFDQTLGRYVAIKVMQKKLAEDKTFADNFVREARAAAALNHQHVVQIYSCSQEKGQLYIVMELVDGGRLDQMIEGGKALDEVFTLEVGVQVANGLQAANDIGLIHGDIKPANILFDKQQRAKVVDFGLARFAAQQHLQPGEIWGTPYYIAPEKVRAQQEDHRADIYSLGATLYHVLTGAPPFDGETAKDVVLARLKSPATSLRTVRPSLQAETADVIARTLEPDPTRRYPTYKSLLADLEEALRVARQRHGMPPPKEKSTSRAPLVVGVLAVAAVIGGAVYWFSGEEEPEPLPPPTALTPDPAPPTPEPPPAEPVQPDITYPEQPFSDQAQARIKAAVDAWAEGDESGYARAMNDLFRAMPRLGVERVWVGLLQAVPAWTERRDGDMRRALRGIQDAQLRELPDDQPHPGAMPRGLARFMVGAKSADDLRQLAEAWPAWFGDLATYFIAVDHLREGRLVEAETALDAYLAGSDADVLWPYHYQQKARVWREQMAEWSAQRAAVAELDLEEGLKQLDIYHRQVPTFLQAAVRTEQDRIRAEIAAEERRQREAEAAQQAALVEADLKKLDGVRDELLALVQARDFRRASTRARQLALPLETDTGRAQLDTLVETYQRMDALKSFLIRNIQREPAPPGLSPDQPREVIAATTSSIRLSLGRDGFMELTWDQVSERMIAALTEYYASQLDDEERANYMLALAIFAYESRAMRPATLYAERALELNPELRAAVERFMPDLND